jgi:uncharacterized membrane protein
MTPTYQLLLIFHVMSAMLWFGGTAFLPRRLREALAVDRDEARRHVDDILSQSRLFAIAATLVLLTGVAMAVFGPGGFGSLPVRYHVALLLTLLWWGLGLFVVRRNVLKVGEVVAGEADLSSARSFATRVGMFTGIQHALFTATTVLMLWRM